MNDSVWFSFGEYALHAGRRELTREGVSVDLGSRATEILLTLLRRPGEVASKADIMRDVWPGIVVAENNLTTQMAQVRRALGDPAGRRFIQTVPGRGYRFVGEVVGHNEPPPARPSGGAIHNLPHDSSSFVGRERQLAELADRLSVRGLVTVVGSGGVGKSRAAVRVASELADRFPDGVLLLELAPLAEARLVSEFLCRKIGAPPGQDRAPLDAAVALMRDRRMLVILDNCEHVLAGAAELADALLRNGPGLRLLATSREALNVRGELVYVLPSLTLPPADPHLTAAAALKSESVRLFADRAADALGGFSLSDADAPAVATICRRLDGVPLAMELAAARLRTLKPAEIAARLENMFQLLNGGSGTVLPRHRTLHAAIDWSHSLLSASEQAVLRRLAVFVDGCTLDGAIAVVAGEDIEPGAVFDLLHALVSKSLAVADTAGSVTRYRLLETTRHYAREKLAAAGEQDRYQRMAAHLLQVFRRAEAVWPTIATDAWLAVFGVEAENFHAAIDWAFQGGDPSMGVALVACAGALADERSLQPDLRRWTETALPHLTDDTPPTEAAAILYLYTTLEKRIGVHAVPTERQRAIELFRQAADPVGLSRALRQTAMARAMPGPLDGDVLAMATSAVNLLRHLAPHKDLATALAHLGSVYFLAGDNERARRLNEEALAMRRLLSDRSGMLASSINLAELRFLDGDVATALRHALEAEAEARERNALDKLALILANLAGYWLHIDQLSEATAAASEALRLSRAIGVDYLAVMCLEHLALIQALRGRLAHAASLLGFTDAHYKAREQTRELVEQRGFERLQAVLSARLTVQQHRALRAAGSAWTAATADAAALQVRAGGEQGTMARD